MQGRALYKERTGWPWWVYPLILLILIAAVIPVLEFAKGNIGSGPEDMPLWGAAWRDGATQVIFELLDFKEHCRPVIPAMQKSLV